MWLFYWVLWSIPVFCSDHTQTPHINPAEYSPEEDLGLLTGMVSPFWAPGRSTHRLHAFILLTEPTGDGEQPAPLVAISLSPWESLLVPRAQFRVLVQRYAQRAYPTLRWLEIDRHAPLPVGDRVHVEPSGSTQVDTPLWATTASSSSLAPPPVPARLRPGAARRSCPWRGRGRWTRTGRCGPAHRGRSGSIAGPARGDSGP